nr:MAG TPA: hypothetical protein [Caudoviricetes sp.]
MLVHRAYTTDWLVGFRALYRNWHGSVLRLSILLSHWAHSVVSL